MSYYVVDVEADGRIPPDFSMVCFAAVRVDDELNTTFYSKVKTISGKYVPDALAISGFSREEQLAFTEDPKEVMLKFKEWLTQTNTEGRPIFWSDNPAFDFQWINYYFHHFLGENPFGHSARRVKKVYQLYYSK